MSGRPARRAAWAAAGIALALYLVTMCRGVYWGDAAGLQRAAGGFRLDATVRGYPLWCAVAFGLRAATGLSPAVAANLVSVLFGALAVLACGQLLARLDLSAPAVLAGAATLAVSHLMWSSSVVAEVYSLTALFLLGLAIAGRALAAGSRRGALAFGLLTGFSLLHHRMIPLAALFLFLAILLLPGRPARPLSLALRVAAGTLLGAVPYLLLFFHTYSGPLAHSVADALFGTFTPHLPGQGIPHLPRLLLYELRFLILDFAGPQLLLLGIGIAALRRHTLPPAVPLGLVAAGVVAPLLFPHVGDRFVLLLPAVVAGALLAGLGYEAVSQRLPVRALRVGLLLLVLGSPPALYGALASSRLLSSIGLFRHAAAHQSRAFLWPGKSGETDADHFGRTVLARLPANATVYSGWADGEVLRYLMVREGLRPDVILESTDALRSAPPDLPSDRCYVTWYPYLPPDLDLPAGFRLAPVRPRGLFHLEPARGPAGGNR